ncbi:aldo/keto reductase [Granulosicoccus antarcticus]|uniref:Putative oxidoreductase n=1 Tax=Granulosicoccus antarcticus IMCC3135 TaxID=1192854 RepID=A0A2Z2NUU1_9GAMM|nr:aldo/keto reductase [Granulosicoccus antarcticus]ASJ71437.1 putative oxidoreductase [Granulosicoccus antarcticus IMCC3135]
MKMRSLGRTETQVSQLCLGSMTWGTQNTYAEAAEQIACALEHGVNFIDTAEMYPTTPLTEATLGDTETIIGQWVAQSGRRNDVVLATKVTGNGREWIYGGKDITAEKIRISVERSLKRLQTDRIDLYQLHWPNRGSYAFRQALTFDPSGQETDKVRDNIHEVLRELDAQVKAGRILHIGLSNESCWGTSQYLSIARQENLPQVVSVQNEYNLLNRLYDLDMAEMSHHEGVGLLAFSPLAAGMLTGKYDNEALPEGSRRTLNANLGGRYMERSKPVCEKYVALAREHDLDPAQMALAFCLTRPFMTSAIIGATTMEQLKVNLAAAALELSDEVKAGIQNIYEHFPVPM